MKYILILAALIFTSCATTYTNKDGSSVTYSSAPFVIDAYPSYTPYYRGYNEYYLNARTYYRCY